MSNKKEFIGILLSVLISVFLVFVIVYATTTVGDNITVGGTITINGSSASTELTVLGTASISEDLWASGSFQFGGGEGTATVSYSRLGTGTTGHSLADAYDLLITGMLEINGIAYFDSTSVFGDIASANYGLIVDSMLQVGHGASVSYSRFGSGTTGHSLADADDLLITGLLEIDDAAYFDSTASISTSLRVPLIYGNVDAGGYLRIGDEALTSHSLAAEDDLLITGKLEVDGTAYFDGVDSVSSTFRLDNGITVTTGVASASGACGTAGSFYLANDASMAICGTDGAWNPK